MSITHEEVVRFLDHHIEATGKSNYQIAEECGFPKANMVSMVRTGKANLPIARTPLMAKSLGIDPKTLVTMVFRAYHPETWQVIEEVLLSSDCTA